MATTISRWLHSRFRHRLGLCESSFSPSRLLEYKSAIQRDKKWVKLFGDAAADIAYFPAGWIDGTLVAVCRPGGPYELQRMLFNGKDRVHALKFIWYVAVPAHYSSLC